MVSRTYYYEKEDYKSLFQKPYRMSPGGTQPHWNT